jgi:hypothetical protein
LLVDFPDAEKVAFLVQSLLHSVAAATIQVWEVEFPEETAVEQILDQEVQVLILEE